MINNHVNHHPMLAAADDDENVIINRNKKIKKLIDINLLFLYRLLWQLPLSIP
jgi:hypothetical protein